MDSHSFFFLLPPQGSKMVGPTRDQLELEMTTKASDRGHVESCESDLAWVAEGRQAGAKQKKKKKKYRD